MKIEYAPEVNALYVRLTGTSIVESEQVQPGIMLDFDADGKVVAVEVLNASQPPQTPFGPDREARCPSQAPDRAVSRYLHRARET